MKLSIYYAHLLQAAYETGRPLDEICSRAHGAGIEAVDLMYTELTNPSLPDYRTFGFALSGVPVWFDFSHRSLTRSDLDRIDDIQRAGATHCLLLPGRFAPGDDRGALMPRILDATAAVADRCVALGIEPTMEPYDTDDVPFHDVAGLRRFLDAIPSLGITIDTGNFKWSDTDLLDGYAALKNRMNYIHAKDFGPIPLHGEKMNLSDGGAGFYPSPIGQGAMPLARLFRELVRDGYDGTIVIELPCIHCMEEAIETSAAFIREEWAKAVAETRTP